MKYLTTREYAEKYGLQPSTVEMACRKGRLAGAVQPTGRDGEWRIPDPGNTEKKGVLPAETPLTGAE